LDARTDMPVMVARPRTRAAWQCGCYALGGNQGFSRRSCRFTPFILCLGRANAIRDRNSSSGRAAPALERW